MCCDKFRRISIADKNKEVEVKCIRSICMFIFGVCLLSNVHANEALLNHVKATSQAMSAFYMQSLSEGNEKYLLEFEKYKRKSFEILKQYESEKGERSQEFMSRWKKLNDRLVLTLDKEYGWEVDGSVRQEFRSYLSDIFQLVDTQKNQYTSKEEKQLLSVVQLEAISARFFDISSLFNVKVSIFASDKNKLNPEVINTDFKNNLDVLADMSANDVTKRKLASVKSKWEFVENSVVNYEGHGAYFVVYATKNKIQRSLVSL